jgi:hypothetical protein
VCLEHTGYALAKANRWWAQRSPDNIAPRNVSIAMSEVDYLEKPFAIRIRRDGQFWRVMQARFA